jgi:hypothetical protein
MNGEAIGKFLGELLIWGKPYIIAIGVLIIVSWSVITAIHKISGKTLPKPIRASIPIVLSLIYYFSSEKVFRFDILATALAIGALSTSAYEIAMKFIIRFLEERGRKLIRREKADTPTPPTEPKP